ncbi:MAG: hypothetical protein JOY99_06730 [Sphingomonadaceae bacterium]|nr:hypothetical protein [Sphingomonadaceae bacterium]
MAFLLLALSGCSDAGSSRAWTGYLFANAVSGGPLQAFSGFPSLAACRADLRSRISHMPAGAGYSCGRGCPAPRHGQIADCAETGR